MKNKHLLFFAMMFCILSTLKAQDTIRTLIITEARLDDVRESYVELTNVGTTPLNLSQFEIGIIGAWSTPWGNTQGYWFMLPDKVLDPGKSFLIASAHDWNPRKWQKEPDRFFKILTKKEMWTLADMLLHFPESPYPDPTDSVSPNYRLLETWGGRDCIYIRHHLANGDSVVVDQVNGIFDGSDGQRANKGAYAVAGIPNATNTCTLVRKASVKKGNVNFDQGRGQDLTESEWIPIPHQLGSWEMWRALYWTAGNHGDYKLSSFTSTVLNIDMTAGTITVPWGVRNDDDIMNYCTKVPGLAWNYKYNSDPATGHEDSSYSSVRTGDTLIVYACGNTLETKKFRLIAAPPTDDANLVIPKYHPTTRGNFVGVNEPFCTVTKDVPGMDTIMDIAYGLRIDTLLLYLEKAPESTWKIEFVDGITRPDLKTGDKLVVTSKSGKEKKYYIKTMRYLPSHNAQLSSITWPDMPETFKGLYGWNGDTIPNFDQGVYTYRITVFHGINQIPALIAKTSDVNAKLEITRADNLNGTTLNRTYKFKVTAEDDTTIRTYTIILEKEQLPENVQPYAAEPFISEYIFQEQWGNGFMEIVNPGTVNLDLSNYMIVGGYFNTPADAITYGATPTEQTFKERYRKYIPGKKWNNDFNAWSTEPYKVQSDINVNAIVYPKDVFAMGHINSTGQSGDPKNWFAAKACDVILGNKTYNSWADPTIDSWASACHEWWGSTMYLFKILNDSVKNGDKQAIDPNDFELIDVIGSGDGSRWNINGRDMDQIESYVRKPHIYKGNTVPKASFKTGDTCEWNMYNRAYYSSRGIGWPNDILYVALDLGKHYMDPFTGYISTINSLVYKVSEGFSMNESINGVKQGTTVTDFLATIVKMDPGQVLTVKSKTTGNVLAGTDQVSNGDTLIVVSAANIYTSKYVIGVTAEGLSGNATLTSSTYTINVTGATGTITGFDYGITIKSLLDKVTVPAGAFVNIIDDKGAPVSLKVLNFDTAYVDAKVSDKVFIEVISENRANKIVYQLKPTATAADAFVTSDVYSVDQTTSVISLVPEGTTVAGLIKNLIPAPGATITIKDNLGNVRTLGDVAKDDVVIVKSADNSTERLYYLLMLNDQGTLAIIYSTVYKVNQVTRVVSIPEGATIETVKANLIPALAATFKIVDKDGVEKTAGTIAADDKIRVTSGNGKLVVNYAVNILISVNTSSMANVMVYPNPATDALYISGLTAENIIEVYNVLGANVLSMNATSSVMTLPVQNFTKGVYVVNIRNSSGETKHFKVVLK